MIQDIAGCDDIKEFTHSEDIMKLLKKKDKTWKRFVPEKIQKIVEKLYA